MQQNKFLFDYWPRVNTFSTLNCLQQFWRLFSLLFTEYRLSSLRAKQIAYESVHQGPSIANVTDGASYNFTLPPPFTNIHLWHIQGQICRYYCVERDLPL